MQIQQLAANYKQENRFIKLSKNDTEYRFKTSKYVVDVVYATSNFYAPVFYYVTVKNNQNEIIWSGDKAIFLDRLFSAEFISDKFDSLILNRVNDTTRSNSMQIILIDLKTGEEKNFTQEGFYADFGHFISFDGIFYSESKDLNCIDFETGKTFLLNQTLKKHFSDIKTWGVCPIDYCILVITKAKENNVALFDLRKQEIKALATLQWKEADQVNLQIGSVQSNHSTIVTISYSNRLANGILINSETEYFEIRF